MASKLLSTGQAAKVCSVTPDTILKWIRSGRLSAQRTAGGHHRVDRQDLEEILRAGATTDGQPQGNGDGDFHFCWEHRGDAALREGCQECVVYALRAQHCFEVVKLPSGVGHAKLFCEQSCDDCDYFKAVHEQPTKVLVVTNDEALTQRLVEGASTAPFHLELATCAYDTSAAVQTFQPDYVVVDCSLGARTVAELTSHLATDPRLPGVRVILAGQLGEFPDVVDEQVFARVHKPFTLADLASCFASTMGRPRGELG